MVEISEWTEGISGENVIILLDGQPVSISELLAKLNEGESCKSALREAVSVLEETHEALVQINPHDPNCKRVLAKQDGIQDKVACNCWVDPLITKLNGVLSARPELRQREDG